ncbi:hypothetical protein N0V86_004997 [Didymella sp. IMI 355093]|nr:hypothetical protein N0V86_004997 [Didymella sp. IMI 355093]
MRDATTPEPALPRSTAVLDVSKVPSDGRWYWVDPELPATEPRPASQEQKHYLKSPPEWSAVHDFERRLSRNGIKVSETGSSHTSKVTMQPVVRQRNGALSILDEYAQPNAQRSNHHASRSEDFPPFEAPTMASFMNIDKQTKMDALERQLRQAQAETKIWQERFERQEQNLHTSYKETMEWRKRYEDLYSALIWGQDTGLREMPKRGATKSLG